MTTVKWTNEQLGAAVQQLQVFVGELQGHGPTGYKAGRLLREWQPAHQELTNQARKLIGEYRRMVPDGNGGQTPLPVQQDGRSVPAELWSTNPAEYAERDKALMQVSQEITAPVRFTYEELVGIPTVRGTFWQALGDLIDAPKEVAPPAPPAPMAPPATPQG